MKRSIKHEALLSSLALVALGGFLCAGCGQNTTLRSSVTSELERAIRQAQNQPAVNCPQYEQTAAQASELLPVTTTPTGFVQAALLTEDQPIILAAADNDKSPEYPDTSRNKDQHRLEPIPSFSEVLKNDVRSLPKSLWEDTKRVYLDKTNLTVLLIAGGASLAVRNTVDDKWEDHFDKHRSFRSEWGDLGGVLGNPGVHFAVAAAAYAYGLKTQDAKTYHVGKTLVNALAINGLSTVALKLAACTEAPNGEDWAWPSGHTSSAVCFAAVLDEAYGPWVGVPLYAMAGFVGFERMDDREHHFSDVLFGAALGYIVGKTVAEGHAPEIFGGKISPYVDPYYGSSGLAWVKEF